MAGINLSLRTIERNVSGSYNVGSLRLNADNRLEHVNSHVFKTNNDHVTKEENEAVRKAINSSFRNAYARNSATNVDLDTALNDVQKFLLGEAEAPNDDTLHTELSRDEVRALLKGLYRINKGGAKNIAEGQRWIEKAKVIRELKAGRVIVDKNYLLVAKNKRKGNAALKYYQDRYGVGADKAVKLDGDFLRGCKWGGTTDRWERTIRSGTGEQKSVEIVLAETPNKIKTCFRERLKTTVDANQRVHVSLDTTGWGPKSRAVAKSLAWMLQNSLNALDEQATEQEQQEFLNALFDKLTAGLFEDDKGLVAKFLAGEPSLYNFAKSKPKEHLRRVLLKGYNDKRSGELPGVYSDFLRVGEGQDFYGWMNVSGPWPTDIPYTFEGNEQFVKVKKGETVGDAEILRENQRVIKKLCAIKNEKVRKMVTCFHTAVFETILLETDLLDSLANDKNSRETLKKSPFAGYLLMDGKNELVMAKVVQTKGDDRYGRTDVNISEDGNTVELTVRKLVTLEHGAENLPNLLGKPLKKPVCVEYKLTITPGEGDGDPNVTVTSAKVLPNVSTIKPDEFFQTVVSGLDQLDDSGSQVPVGDPKNPTPIEKIALDLERFKGLFKLYFADGNELLGEGEDKKFFEGEGFTLAELIANKDVVLAKWRKRGPFHKWLADAVEDALDRRVPLEVALAENMRDNFLRWAQTDRHDVVTFNVGLAVRGFLKGMRRETNYTPSEKKELVRLYTLAREREKEIKVKGLKS